MAHRAPRGAGGWGSDMAHPLPIEARARIATRWCIDDECSVCMQTLLGTTVFITPCKHVFHARCLRRWSDTSMSLRIVNVHRSGRVTRDYDMCECPLCRHVLWMPGAAGRAVGEEEDVMVLRIDAAPPPGPASTEAVHVTPHRPPRPLPPQFDPEFLAHLQDTVEELLIPLLGSPPPESPEA